MRRLTIRKACGLGVFVALMAAAAMAFASGVDKKTLFTFSRPITLPGVTLPAGEYQFRLADVDTGRRVIRVLSADGTKAYALLFSIPEQRVTASSAPEVRFMETAKGHPSAVKTWWFPGELTGFEFIYPKEQARRLMLATGETVLTTRTETAHPEDTKAAPLERLGPAGQEIEVAAVEPPAEPTGSSQTGTVAPEAPAPLTPRPAPQQMARNEAAPPSGRSALPATASGLPWFGLIGILAFAGAGGLEFLKGVRR